MKSILDPSFRYIASFDTDLRRTFKRVRDEQKSAALERSTTPADRLSERAQRVAYLIRSRIMRSPLP